MSEENCKQSLESPKKTFDIQLVYDSFTKCSKNIDALDMEEYLAAFKELYKFFKLLGTVFSFVSSDIMSKVLILEEYRKSDQSDEYRTVQSMITFENASGVIANQSRPSGSRTLLRLHRALEFIMYFMKEMSEADAEAQSSVIARNCYDKSLSKYHPWLIQKGAHIAMYSLPTRQPFMERVFGGFCDSDRVRYYEKLMGDIANISEVVYKETQKLYQAHNLLNLP